MMGEKRSEATKRRATSSIETLQSNSELDNNLKFLAAGGEHIVLTVDKDDRKRGVLIKVSYHDLCRSLRDRGYQPDGYLKPKAKELESRYENLVTIFGDNVLKEHIEVKKVPVSAVVATELYTVMGLHEMVKEPVEVDTIVHVQERVKSDVLGKSKTLGCRYPETFFHPLDYKSLDEMTLDGTQEFDKDIFFNLLKRETQKLLEIAEIDSELKGKLVEFIRKAIKFTERFNDGLDFIGHHNVIFYKDDNDMWNYKLIDAIASIDWNKGVQEINRLRADSGVVSVDMLNIVNYVRFINGLAIHLGVDDSIDISGDMDMSFGNKSFVVRNRLREMLSRNGVPLIYATSTNNDSGITIPEVPTVVDKPTISYDSNLD